MTLILTNELRGLIVKNNLTQKQLAEELGMSKKTFYLKMKKGVFGSDDIEKMIDILQIEDPISVFFAKKVT